MHAAEELRALVEEALERLELWPQLAGPARVGAVRAGRDGGKRIRPVISLAVGEALEAPPEQVMPSALALELVHNFSLVHDDLPALDGDEERRGKPSVWAAYGEGKAVLAGRRTAGRGVPASPARTPRRTLRGSSPRRRSG